MYIQTISETSNTNDNKQLQKINELKNEVKYNTKYNNRKYKYRSNKNKQSTTTEFKNGNAASATNRGQQENIDLFKVMNFVEESMKNLSNHEEQLKIKMDFNLTQQGM